MRRQLKLSSFQLFNVPVKCKGLKRTEEQKWLESEIKNLLSVVEEQVTSRKQPQSLGCSYLPEDFVSFLRKRLRVWFESLFC